MKLTADQQQTARDRAVATAQLAYQNAAGLHYSQDMAKRWYGISQHKDASQGQWPSYADCSGLVTWCIWNAVFLPYGMEDIVNASKWASGYTGTMLGNGTKVSASNCLPGDAVIYGGGTGAHTAIVVGKSGGTPMVISHGSESGPHYVAYNYRSDVNCFIRYIDGNEHAASNAPTPTPTPPEGTVAIFAVVKQDGRIEVFAQKQDGTVLHTWQTSKDGGWSGAEKGKNASWSSLGNPGK